MAWDLGTGIFTFSAWICEEIIKKKPDIPHKKSNIGE
jgi:hypothetical protein